MKALFFDIFGTLVDWRSSIIKGSQKLEVFKNRIYDLEEFVISWRKEYQPILNKVNNKSISWKTLDELHEMTLEKVLKKMKFYKLSKKEKKYLIMLWHKLDPWNDSIVGLNELNKYFITASLSNGNIRLQKNLFNYAKLKFDFLFSAEHFKKYKPNKIVYIGAARMLNLKPDECALVASHKNDLYAASKLGMRTVFIKREDEYGSFKYKFIEKKFKPDLEVSCLKHLIINKKKLNH